MIKSLFGGQSGNNDTVSVNRRELELLEGCLKKCSQGYTRPDIPTSSPLYPLLELLEQAVQEREQTLSQGLLQLNEAVGSMTSMTSIRDMLGQLAQGTNQLTGMAAQAEEMGASVSEMAATAGNAANFVEQSVRTAGTGVEKIEQALSFVEHSFADFEQVNTQVQQVLSSISKIENIIGVIAGVAEQTNLLALNAAIEAARAGDQGKGFAVVADEVRKLAEYTKSSVNEIKQNIDSLTRNSTQTAGSISNLSQVLQEGRDKMRDAGLAIEQILSNMHSISDSITQVAAGSEEQSAVVEEFSSTVTTLADSANMTEKLAKATGKQIYELSQFLGDVRSNFVSMAPRPDTFHALELVKTDHYLWTWRIYNMLLGYKNVDPHNIGTHHDCRLGQWAASEDAAPFRSSAIFQHLETPHRQVHDLAREAAAAYQKGDRHKADQLLNQMTGASNQVVEILSGLQQLVNVSTLASLRLHQR